ncbi:MAG: hypothetical protein ACYCOO_02970 [Chitinophagaceae bacterium]
MATTSLISALQQDLMSWKTQVDTSRLEIKYLKERLEEVVSKNNSRESLVQVEHYENSFLRQREVADELFHELKQAIKKLKEDDLLLFPGPGEGGIDPGKLREEVFVFNKLFQELTLEFNHFLQA